VTREELSALEPEQAAAKILLRVSTLVGAGDWFTRTVVVAEEHPTENTAKLVLRGVDGAEKEIWFRLENGRWAFDFHATRW
jgi:hypothetical protein